VKVPVNFQGARLPINYKAAKQALAECDRVDECKTWADKAEAVATYARISSDREMELTARRIRLRAIARIGELLLQIPNTSRGLHTAGAQLKGGSLPNPASRLGIGRAAGLRPQDVNQALSIARIPPEIREVAIESADPPKPSVLEKHPARIRPRPVRFDRFTPGPEYRAVFLHAGGLTMFTSFLKKHPPEKYFPLLSPAECLRARRYLQVMHGWLAEAERHFPEEQSSIESQECA
jgi:hypothetical protein